MTVEPDTTSHERPIAAGSTRWAPEWASSRSSASRMLMITVGAVFVTEAGVMAILAVLPPFPTGVEAVIDSAALSILVFPFLYLTVFRPLVRQIERRKSAEDALRASQNLLSEAQRVASVGHWVWQIPDNTVQWSDETYRIFGFTPGATKVSYEAFLDLVHPDDRQTLRSTVEEALRELRGYRIEHRILLPGGEEKVVHAQAEMHLDASGRPHTIIGVVQDITERRRAQEALEDSYAELDRRVHERTAELAAANAALQRERNFVDAVVDTAGALVIVLNRHGEIVRFNKACEQVSGYSHEEVRGRRFWDLLIPEDERAGVVETFNRLRAGDFPNQHQNHWLKRDGEPRFISWSNTALCTDVGEVEYVIGTGVDITERRQTEEALRASEERYRTILRTARDGFWTIDTEGTLVDVNDSYCRLSGYTRDELIGSHLGLVEFEEDRAEVARHIERVMTQGHDRFETRHRRKDGKIVDVEVSVTLLQSEEDLMFTFLRDVTDRNRDAAELARSRAELEAIINSSADAIVFTDKKRRIALVNPAFKKIFGYNTAEVLGRTTHFLDLDKRPPEGVVEQNRSSFEIQCLHKDGSTLWVETQAVAVRDSNGALLGHVGTHRDISQRRRAEAQIRASLQEKEVLLKEIHHRVKNNLQVIASMLNLQADRVHDESALAHLRESRNRIRSLALIHEKLYRSTDLAHIDFAEYVNDLANSVVSSVNRAPTQITVETVIADIAFDLDTTIPVALMVNELVSNSVKHAFAGRSEGRIRISLAPADNDRFQLIVADDGTGFPADLEQRSANTLGLQLVEVLTAQLDGRLRLDGGNGARVEIEFAKSNTGGHGP